MISQLFAIPLRILVVAATLPTPPALGAVAANTSARAVVMLDDHPHLTTPFPSALVQSRPALAIAPTGG
jgi:hypothetical protein